LMMLPRDDRLLGDILSAGILPDRSSPTDVEYTVPTSVLQDADPKVRLEALLAVSELPPSPRAAAVVAEVLASPSNASDPWLPDAAAIAGAHQGADLVLDIVRRPLPNDSASIAGIAKAVRMMARFHGGAADTDVAVSLVGAARSAPEQIGRALVQGIAEGWPEGRAPSLTASQRAELAAAARGAPSLAAAFTALADRWGTPDIFRAP
jgi:hypothetical protein